MKLFREALIIFGIYLLGEFISKLFDIAVLSFVSVLEQPVIVSVLINNK